MKMSVLVRYFYGYENGKKGNGVGNDEGDDVGSSACDIKPLNFSSVAFYVCLLYEQAQWHISTMQTYLPLSWLGIDQELYKCC